MADAPILSGRKKLAANIILAIISCLFSFGMAEVGARVYLTQFASTQFFNKYASLDQLYDRYGEAKLVPHRYLGFYPTPNYRDKTNYHNALGFRGDEITLPKPEGVFRIVCFGGSTTYSTSVDDYHQTYPYRLQEYLRGKGYTQVEVINAGVHSYSSWETLVNFEFRTLDLEPDMVIVYHGVNDVDARVVSPDKYAGDGSGYARRIVTTSPPFLENSTLLRIFLVYFKLSEPHTALWKNFIEAPGSYYGNDFQNQVLKQSYPSGDFRKLSVMQMLESNPPVYMERNLRNLIAIAQDYDIQVLLLTFTRSPSFTDNPRAFTPEYEFGLIQSNTMLKSLANETGVYLYDFSAEMPDDHKYFSDGIHFTAEGNQVRAELIGKYILSENILSQPDPTP